MSLLKVAAPSNIPSIVVTLLQSHEEILSLNDPFPLNISFMSVTSVVTAVDISFSALIQLFNMSLSTTV